MSFTTFFTPATKRASSSARFFSCLDRTVPMRYTVRSTVLTSRSVNEGSRSSTARSDFTDVVILVSEGGSYITPLALWAPAMRRTEANTTAMNRDISSSRLFPQGQRDAIPAGRGEASQDNLLEG